MKKITHKTAISLLVASLIVPLSLWAKTTIIRTPKTPIAHKEHSIKPAIESLQTAYKIRQAKKQLAERIQKAPAGSLAAGTYSAGNFQTLQQATTTGVVNTMPPVNGEGIPDEIMVAIKSEMKKFAQEEFDKMSKNQKQTNAAELNGQFSFTTDTNMDGQAVSLKTDVDYTFKYDFKDLKDIKAELISSIDFDVNFKGDTLTNAVAEAFNLDKGHLDFSMRFVDNKWYFQVDNISDNIKYQLNQQNREDNWSEIDWSVFEGRWIEVTDDDESSPEMAMMFMGFSPALSELQQSEEYKAQLLASQEAAIEAIDTWVNAADKLFEKYPIISFTKKGSGQYSFRLDKKYLIPFVVEFMHENDEVVTADDLEPIKEIQKYVRTMSGEIAVNPTGIDAFSLNADVFVPEDDTLPEIKSTIKTDFTNHKNRSSYSLQVNSYMKMNGSELARLDIDTAGKKTSDSYEDRGKITFNFDDDWFGSSQNSLSYSVRAGKFNRTMRIYTPGQFVTWDELEPQLTAMNILGLGEAKRNSENVNTISTLKNTETALILDINDDEERDAYWTEKELSKSDPTIKQIVQKTSGVGSSLSNYLSGNFSENTISPDKSIYYDNDGDEATKCTSDNIDKGVNLVIKKVSLHRLKELDKIVDGTVDGNCGKLRYRTRSTSDLYYRISDTQKF